MSLTSYERNGVRDVIRWLLRPLSEPAFLRLYLEHDEKSVLPLVLFETTFFGLSPNSEHPEESRAAAWKELAEWLREEPASPIVWYHRLLKHLASRETEIGRRRIHDDVVDLARYWSLPELFAKPGKDEPTSRTRDEEYYELHCHLRGAVPFMYMWNEFLGNERVRANLRKEKCVAGGWSKTWGDLCADAAEFKQEIDKEHPEAQLNELARLVQSSPDHLSKTRYLAICAGLRRHLLHQRGEVGLSSFVISYDRYSKLQKRSGLAERTATREAVRAILDKFQAQGCVAIELRPTLETTAADLRRKLQNVIYGYFDHVRDPGKKDRPPLAMGLVPSLFKQELIGKNDSDAESHAQIWEEQAKRWSHEVELLLNAIDVSPALRHFVVGIDAAGKESGCPPRVLARAFALVRDRTGLNALARVRAGRVMSLDWMKRLVTDVPSGEEPARHAWEQLERAYVPHARLGFTVHAGEDFADPLTGLRHIWESVHALELREGDRIGHAIAASLASEQLKTLLTRRAGKTRDAAVEKLLKGDETYFRIRKPHGTHLLDLAWAFEMAETNDERNAAGTALMHAVGDTSRHALDVERIARTLQGNHATMQPYFSGVRFHDPAKIHPEHWCWIHLDEVSMSLFETLRRRVLRELVRKEIVIESCPTSNLAVANLRHPPLRVFMKVSGLRCAVATDDPGLLDAWPANEFDLALRDENDPEQLKRRLVEENKRSSFVRIA